MPTPNVIDNNINGVNNTIVSHDNNSDKVFDIHVNTNVQMLKCCLVNVCGLKSKLLSPDFEKFISEFDIIAVTETKLSDLDCTDNLFLHYDMLYKNRKGAKRASGGIAILIKKNISKHVHTIEIDNNLEHIVNDDFVIWVKVVDMFEYNIIMGITYIPPENSNYSSIELFDDLENQMLSFDVPNAVFCIVGDFNARSKNMNEILNLDQHVIDPSNDMIRSQFDNELVLNEYNIPLERKSQDHVCNNYGKRLVELCSSMGLVIANGRSGKDRFIGKTTCDGVSLIDYVLCSPEILVKISEFQVLSFCNMLSDKHNPVSFTFNIDNANLRDGYNVNVDGPIDNDASNTCNVIVKWSSDKKESFVNGLDFESIHAIEQTLEQDIITNNVTQTNVDNIVSLICKVFDTSAEQCNMKRRVRQNKTKRLSQIKPWFNDKCEEKRKAFFNAKNNVRSNNSDEHKIILKNLSKNYKRQLLIEHKLYFKELNRKLQALSTSNPKDYWDILNNGCRDSIDSPDSMPSIIDFKEHFKTLNNGPVLSDIIESNLMSQADLNTSFELDSPITSVEILDCIKNLKNNKATGDDLVLNEYIKSSANIFINVYVKLFNVILNNGIIPEKWFCGTIIPLYKKKGDKSNTDNYRGITIMSCLGKLFTSIINSRLTRFVDNLELIGAEQAGFRKGFSTVDHLFTFKCIIDLYLSRKKKLFCAFIDYKKAFDSVDRLCLWKKLLRYGITGKIFKVVFNLYKHAKSCVKVKGSRSSFFSCLAGVRQGENLSPLLFAIFLCDLENFMSTKYRGLSFLNDTVHATHQGEGIDLYLHLFVLLYADDTILLAESKEELQLAINAMKVYCDEYKLNINTNKTKVMVFSRGKIRIKPVIYFGEYALEVVFDYVYLGVTMCYNGTFTKAIKRLYDIANRAMFALIKKGRRLCLNTDIMLKLFEHTIVPILLYGSEVWGFTNINLVEKLHLRFCKILLNVKKCTTTAMVYGELGQLPLARLVQCRLLNFWFKLATCPNSKLSCILYKQMLAMHNNKSINFKWLISVKNNLDNLGFSNVWTHQGDGIDQDWFKNAIKQRLFEHSQQYWISSINESSKCTNYKIFKEKLGYESYLNVLPSKLCKAFTKFRCSNHRLPVEVGSYSNIPRNERLCKLCNSNQLGDEYHFVLECNHFSLVRKGLIKAYYIRNPSSYKFKKLFNASGEELVNLCKFISHILVTMN